MSSTLVYELEEDDIVGVETVSGQTIWVRVEDNERGLKSIGAIDIVRQVTCTSMTGRTAYIEVVKNTSRKRFRYSGNPASNVRDIKKPEYPPVRIPKSH